MDRLNPLYVPKKLENKKAIAIAIGSTSEEQFSTNGAISSIDSFCENSKMKLILKYQFNKCLDFDDILKQQDKIDEMINEIKKRLKN